MTYNIRGGLGMDGRRSTARIAETVAAHAPDIICFQEIHQRLPWSRMVDQPRRLGRLLQTPFVFQRNLSIGVGGYGVGIATRFPVVAAQHRLLPSVKEQRGALEVRLRTPEGDLTVFCTHWGLDREERNQQAAQMAEWINAAPRPVLVCGDLNDPPGAASVQGLLARTGLQDADAAAGRLTFPAGAPKVRIDYIFCSGELCSERTEVVETLSSDHYPVFVDVTL
jgi:endonuclease/exonuclease/phosphatase family metal-dependent hydrolase